MANPGFNLQIHIRNMRAVADAATRSAIRVEKAGNRRAVRKASTPMLKEARRRVPVGATGRLKRSLTSHVRTEGRAIKSKIGARQGTAASKYLHLVEFGTRHSEAKPFLRPAFESKERESRRIYRQTVWEDIKAEAAKARAKTSR